MFSSIGIGSDNGQTSSSSSSSSSNKGWWGISA
jgi:hypothetical protein